MKYRCSFNFCWQISLILLINSPKNFVSMAPSAPSSSCMHSAAASTIRRRSSASRISGILVSTYFLGAACSSSHPEMHFGWRPKRMSKSSRLGCSIQVIHIQNCHGDSSSFVHGWTGNLKTRSKAQSEQPQMLGTQNPTLQEVFEEVNQPNTCPVTNGKRLGAFEILSQEKDGFQPPEVSTGTHMSFRFILKKLHLPPSNASDFLMEYGSRLDIPTHQNCFTAEDSNLPLLTLSDRSLGSTFHQIFKY